MTAGHGFSAGLALGHSSELWKYPLSPPPGLMLGWFPPSPFLLLHSKAGAGGGTLGSRAEEGGSRGSQTDRRIPCFRLREEGTYCFLGSQPTGGVCGNPAHSSHRSLLSYVAPGPESCPAITNGALCSRDKEHAPHPQPGPGLVCLAPTLASEGIVPLPGGETEV